MTRIEKLFGVVLITISCGAVFSCKITKTVASKVVSVSADTTEIKLSEDTRKEFEYLYIEGIKQKSLNNFDDAIKIFSRCLEIDPRSSATLYEMANIHVLKGDFQSSMFLLERAVAINPDNQYYHLYWLRSISKISYSKKLLLNMR